jgi:hypothetical protein
MVWAFTGKISMTEDEKRELRLEDIKRLWEAISQEWLDRKLKDGTEKWSGLSIRPVKLGDDRSKHPMSQYGVEIIVENVDGTEFCDCISFATMHHIMMGVIPWVTFSHESSIGQAWGSLIGKVNWTDA